MINLHTKFEVTSLNHSRVILGGLKLKGVTWHDNAPLRNSLSSVGWDLLWSTLTSNLMSLSSPTMKIRKARKM